MKRTLKKANVTSLSLRRLYRDLREEKDILRSTMFLELEDIATQTRNGLVNNNKSSHILTNVKYALGDETSARYVYQDGDSLRDCVDVKARKYFPRFDLKNGLFSYLGPNWALAINLYLRVLPTPVSSELKEYLTDKLVRGQTYGDKSIRKFLKAVSTQAKKQTDTFSINWRYYVGMENFGGYLERIPLKEFEPEVEDWTNGWRYQDLLGDEDLYLKVFAVLCADIVGLGNLRDTKGKMDVNTWLKSGLWATDGSTTIKNGHVEFRDKKIKIPKTKKWNYYTQELEDMQKAIWSNKITNKVIEKLELGKVRPLVAGDTGTYLKMAYLSYIIDDTLKHSYLGEHSPIFMSERKVQESYKSTCERIKRRDGYNVPIDQDSFDHGPTKAKVKICLNVLCELANEADRQEIREITRLLLENWDDQVIYLDDKKLKWKGGILSGWRWTSLLDTIINLVDLRMVELLAECEGRDVLALGDDTKVNYADLAEAVVVPSLYKVVGNEVNNSKFFVSKKYDEFLRIVCTENGSFSYPARGLTSVLYINPINETEGGEDRISSRLDAWNRLVTRGCDPKKCMDYMLRDISNITRLTKSEIDDWLHTPAAYGGYNLYPYNTLTCRTREVISKTEIPFLKTPEWMKAYGIKSMDSISKNIIKTKKIFGDKYVGKVMPKRPDLSQPGVENPSWKQDFPDKLVNIILSECYDQYEIWWNKVRTLLDDKSLGDWEIMNKRNKKMQYAWVNGWRIHLPRIWGVGARASANIVNKHIDYISKIVIARKGYTVSDLNNIDTWYGSTLADKILTEVRLNREGIMSD